MHFVGNYERYIDITDPNAATVFWVSNSDFSSYSSSVVYVYDSDKYILRAAIPDINATKSGYRNGRSTVINVAHEGRRYRLSEFEVRITFKSLL